MILVIDASVVLKWLLADPGREQDTAAAGRLMDDALSGRFDVLQPPHWLVEVGGVLARLSPATAGDDLVMLDALELPSVDEPAVLRRAMKIAVATGQHLFDALYHAIALETPDSLLVTADERYLRAAGALGRIQRLAERR